MLYFSDLHNKTVVSQELVYAGTLTDFIFVNEDLPRITKLVIISPDHHYHTLPISVFSRSKNLLIIKSFEETENRQGNELSIAHNLLDKQVIDLVGNKVVRVNDIAIQDQPDYAVLGIDISTLGILRRLGIEDYIQSFYRMFKIDLHEQLLSWSDIQNLELERGQIQLKERSNKLARIHPEDLADYLERTQYHNAKRFLRTLDDEKASEVFASLQIYYQTKILESLEPDRGAKFIALIDPDEAVDVLLTVHEEKRNIILSLLDEEKRQELSGLLLLSSTPVGNLMTTEFLTVQSNLTVKDIILKIQKETADFSFFSSIYVCNENGLLVGVLSLHTLFLQKPETPAYKCMIQNPFTIQLTTPVELVVKKILRYKLSSLPVIDANKKILGIVTIDDLSEFILQRIL